MTDSFRWISVAVSMILGIGVTRILGAAVTLVRHRDVFRLDALPVAWAAFVFVAQLQFWWAIIELASIKSRWTDGQFLVLVAMPIALFVAAALVLPDQPRERDADLRTAFARDGRIALLAIAAFNAIAVYVDAAWWSQPMLSLSGALMMVLVAIPLLVFAVPGRSLQLALTAAYALALIASEIMDSPASY